MGINSLRQRQVTLFPSRLFRISVLIAGYLVRVISLDFQGLWRDEVDQWRFALSPLKEQLSRFFEIGWNGPLFSPLLRIWIASAGDSVFAMRYFSLLCGVLCISLIYILCIRLTNRKTAFWSALLCAFSPYMVWYAQEIKMYTWVPMLVLLGLYGLERATYQPSWALWGMTFGATWLAFYSHILAALMIPVQIAWFYLTPNRQKKAWIGGGIVLILLVVPYLPLLIWQLPMVFTSKETGYPAYTLFEMVTALLTGWTSGIYMGSWTGGVISRTITGLSCMCALVGFTGGTGKNFRQFCKLLVWMVFPLMLIWLVSLKHPLFTDRYLIWTAPAFTIMVAYGITQFAKVKYAIMWGIGAVVVLSTFPALYSQSAMPIKPQFDKVVAYIEVNSSRDDLLLFQIPYNARVFEYYTQNQVFNQSSAPFTNWRLVDGSYQVGQSYVHQEMMQISGDYPGIWLVYSEVKLWDERELVREWLDTRWILFDEKHYQGVSLFGYWRP